MVLIIKILQINDILNEAFETSTNGRKRAIFQTRSTKVKSYTARKIKISLTSRAKYLTCILNLDQDFKISRVYPEVQQK